MSLPSTQEDNINKDTFSDVSITADLANESSDHDSQHNSTCQFSMAYTPEVSIKRDDDATSTFPYFGRRKGNRADDVIYIMSNNKLNIYVHDNNKTTIKGLRVCSLRVCNGRTGLSRLFRFTLNLMGFYFKFYDYYSHFYEDLVLNVDIHVLLNADNFKNHAVYFLLLNLIFGRI